MEKYNHKEVETKWQNYWQEKKLYKTNLDGAKNPLYNLMMFPYPSAEGLHIGGMYTFTGVDTFGRFQRMNGYDVFEPIGLDAFGIHSENYALKIGEHIKTVSQRTEKHFYQQLHAMGNMYDWDQKVETNKAEYYKWTQWLFTQFFKSGLAYRKEALVKYCPSCKTVLSDEQVINAKCERCSTIVEDKSLKQWFFKITKYAGRLYDNLEKINWDKDVKLGQKNWINKRLGINITYQVADTENISITCFTTRPDTNFGATFVVLAPEHEFVQQILAGQLSVSQSTREKLKEYIESVKNKSEIDRLAEGREKTGVFTGFYCINQLNNKRLPVWVSDFVLGHFGTGAVVGVPGHDKRDFEFAQKFKLEIIRVVKGIDGDESAITNLSQVQEEQGTMINSEFLNGMDIHKATEEISNFIEKNGWGKKIINYNLRDWCVSRQRYWGPPIPMIYCKTCADNKISWFTTSSDAHRVHSEEEIRELNQTMAGWFPDDNLPVKLPEIDSLDAIKPDGSGKGPLASQNDFVNVTCPNCRNSATRETDVSDPFVDSCWYFLRYPFAEYDKVPFGGNFDGTKSLFHPQITAEEKLQLQSRMKKWGPVSYYIGGKEHTVLHLLYARFITMALFDLGYINFEEPFTIFYGHGLITKDGAKMSKSKGNVVNPDEYIEKYGADSIRLYLRFLGPFDQAGDWRDNGMQGMYKFVKRLWKMYEDFSLAQETNTEEKTNVDNIINLTIKELTKDLTEFRFNIALAHIMEYVNWYYLNVSKLNTKTQKQYLSTLALLLAPLAPHIAEEFWQILGNQESVHLQPWPTFDEQKTMNETIQIAIQVNGKVRGLIDIKRGETQEQIMNQIKSLPNIDKYLQKGVTKVIYVQDKIINYIVNNV